jgi:hypothetical protein
MSTPTTSRCHFNLFLCGPHRWKREHTYLRFIFGEILGQLRPSNFVLRRVDSFIHILPLVLGLRLAVKK